MPRLDRIVVYPIKSLDGTTIESATVVEKGGLAWDRRYAIVDENGEYVNGKRERSVHRIRAEFDLPGEEVTLDAPERTRKTFHLDDDRDALDGWLSAHVGYPVELVREDAGGFPDDTDASGPTVIGSGTLRTVASWFDGIGVEEMRRRLRPTLVVADTGPFWEDRLYRRPETTVPFRIGAVDLHGVNPCQRCVVPTRHPDTGEETAGFRTRFVERRRETLPDWVDRTWFDHYYRLMVNTRVLRASWGAELAAGDRVTVDESVSGNFPSGGPATNR